LVVKVEKRVKLAERAKRARRRGGRLSGLLSFVAKHLANVGPSSVHLRQWKK
jgi:hypothetical protein